jgi:chemotaxis protein histidine kinase CheA
VTDHLAGLNDGLLKVEMIQGEEKIALLREMNRLAHSMKGAARAVGVGRIETISHYMEEVFHYALNKGMDITPDIADAIYDGLDLIQNTLADDDTDEGVIADVLANLERIVTLHSDTGNGAKPKKRKKQDKRATQDSEEMPVISIPPIAPQLPPDFEPLAVPPPHEKRPVKDKNHSTPVSLQPTSAAGYAIPADMTSELMSIFRGEMDEHLASLNSAMLQAETMQGEERMALLREMNRVAHSMKGAARAVGFGLIEAMGHHLEEVFGAALADRIQLTADGADSLYDSLDIIQNTLDGETTDAAIVQIVLTNLARIAQGAAPLARVEDGDESPPDAAVEVNETPAVVPPAPSPKAPGKPATDVNDLADLLNTLSQEARPQVATQSTIGLRLTEKFRAISTAEKTLVDGVTAPTAAGADAPVGGTTSTMMLRPTEETIRVAVPKLDSLMRKPAN